MRHASTVVLAITALLAVPACSRPGTSTVAVDPASRSADPEVSNARQTAAEANESQMVFERFTDCDDLAGWVKARLGERVTPWGLSSGYSPAAAGEETAFTEAAAADGTAAPAATEAPAPAEAAATTAASAAADRAANTSGTNTQETGVDESDIAETDGRYVYSIIDGVLRSVDLDTSTLLAEVPLDRGNYQMLLDGESLLLVSSSGEAVSGSFPGAVEGETVVERYSVAGGLPRLLGRTHLEGMPLSARAVDGRALVVLSSPMAARLRFAMPGSSGDDSERQALEYNRNVVDSLTADDLLPRSFDERPDGGGISPRLSAIACDRIGHPGEYSGLAMTWVATIDLRSIEAPVAGAAGVIAQGATVYASTENLYVATNHVEDLPGDLVPVDGPTVRTAIHMFDLGGGAAVEYAASGYVDGTLLNSYSMSEHAGALRVATLSIEDGFGGSGPGAGVHILQPEGSELTQIGAVGGFGVGEQIQAVRFQGDLGFVVTFRRTDPLFVLDLANPTRPKLTGELKVPGYSTYLHPAGEGLLLGVGYAGDDFGLTGGMQFSLFDVNDLSNPTLVSTSAIGAVSEAAGDPHAFLYWPKTGTIVVPKELVCNPDLGEDCSSAVVARLDAQTRTFSEQGRLFDYFPVRRTMVANGDLVTISAGALKKWNLDTLEELADIRFDIPNTTAESLLPPPKAVG